MTQAPPPPAHESGPRRSSGRSSASYGGKPVNVCVLFPEGEGLQTGSVALLNDQSVTSDYYTIRKDKDDPVLILANALTSLLRTAPNRPVSFVLRAVNRAEYKVARAWLDEAFKRACGDRARYGVPGLQAELLGYVAAYAQRNPEWLDQHSTFHTYACTVGDGEYSHTGMIHLTPRRLTYRTVTSYTVDPVAATFSALRDAMIGVPERSALAIWSSHKAVNDAVKRRTPTGISKEAETAGKSMIAYGKSRNLGLSYNGLFKAPLIEMCTALALDGHQKTMSKRVAEAEQEQQPARKKKGATAQ